MSATNKLAITFVKEKAAKISNVCVLYYEGEGLDKEGKALDKQHKGLIGKAVESDGKFKGKNGQVFDIPTAGGRMLVLGMGKAGVLTALKAESAAGKLAAHVGGAGLKDLAVYVAEKAPSSGLKSEDLAAAIANGVNLRSYSFEDYKSKKNERPLKKLQVVYERTANAKKAYDLLAAVTLGTFQARDLVNMPPNDLYPEAYAKIIKDELKPLGVDVEVFDEKKLLKMKAGAIMAVGQGSARQPRMVVMRWNGAGKRSKDKPLAFVGKGVTFDTGGISLKPGANMDEMKMDMGGSAAVVGLMKALAKRKAKVNVVGIVGLAENMPSSNAYRPGDIITSYAGKTIEVLNTDAEGRLVLADCLAYVQEKYDPKFVIDLATLTGAMMISLGHEYCGSFVNDDGLWKGMEKASAISGEKLWRMPLDDAWNKQIESDVADIQNIGKTRFAGSCTAAAFLQEFIDEGRAWAHMDIAGTAWRKSDQPTVPKFGSGFGVRVLDTLVSEDYED